MWMRIVYWRLFRETRNPSYPISQPLWPLVRKGCQCQCPIWYGNPTQVTWQSFPLKSSQVTSQFPPSQVKSQFSGIGNSSKLGMGWGRSPILFLSTAAVWSLSWYPWNWLFTFPVSRHFHFVPYGQISYSLVNIFLFAFFLSRYDLVYQLLNILRKWIWSFRYDFTKRKQTVLLCINLLIPLGFLTVRLFVCFNTILMKMCTIKLTCYRSPNLFKKMIGSF